MEDEYRSLAFHTKSERKKERKKKLYIQGTASVSLARYRFWVPVIEFNIGLLDFAFSNHKRQKQKTLKKKI